MTSSFSKRQTGAAFSSKKFTIDRKQRSLKEPWKSSFPVFWFNPRRNTVITRAETPEKLKVVSETESRDRPRSKYVKRHKFDAHASLGKVMVHSEMSPEISLEVEAFSDSIKQADNKRAASGTNSVFWL